MTGCVHRGFHRVRFTSSILSWGLTLLLIVLLTNPVVAQDTASRVFAETVDVRVINVEVVVTDAKGERVSGLGAEEFRLLVDGKPVPVDYFFEVKEGRAQGRREALASVPALVEQAEESEMDGEEGETAGLPVRTNYMVFIDEFFAAPAQRRLVLEKVLEDLSAIEPQDQVAAVTFDGRRLDLVLDWTSSHPEIEEILREVMSNTARHGVGEQKMLGLANAEADTRLNPVETGGESVAVGEVGGHHAKKTLRDRLILTYHSVATAMRGSAQVPGRRVMLLLSGGWPRDPSAFIGGAGASSPLWRANTELAKLSDIANQTGYTIYGIDVPGSRNRAPTAAALGSHPLDPGPGGGGGGDSGSRQLPAQRRLGSGVLEANQKAFDVGLGRENEVEATLLVLAEKTGGRALLDGQRLNALAAAVDDTRSYYSLGFNRRQTGDDRYHAIEVEVVRPGLKVRARKGFTDLSRSSEVDWLVESSLLLDHQSALPQLDAVLGTPQGDGRRWVQVPVTLTIPLAEIAPLPTAEGARAQLELRVAALAEKGDRSEIATIPLDLDLTHGMLAAPYLEYDAVLRLKRQNQTLVLTLFDRVSGTVLLSRVDLEI